MSFLINRLPYDLVQHIKDYVLSLDIRLDLIYQNHKMDEKKLQKILSTFSSEQLENINWKHLYYKLYKTSPPRCDNANLQPIFDKAPNPPILNTFTDELYEPFKLYHSKPLSNYKLFNVTRSDYYSDKVRTEIGKKRQQYLNIVQSWAYLQKGRGSAKIPEIDMYILNVEYELIRTILIMHNHMSPKTKTQKLKTKN